MPDSCPALARANLSRKRAWAELKKLRAALEAVGPVPPPPRPPDLQQEGEILREAWGCSFFPVALAASA
jgi:hypothetical protein